ncbi:MAG: ATP synthase F1 subunit gamma [Eubacteriales bacterium]|nr:ATP synthase F1 subunit gamma [Eubacteriales bacterium]
MAGLREIQNRIRSIKDTRKITNAMYMISSTKMRKAREALEHTEPYFYTLQAMMDRMMRHFPDVSHIYFEKEEPEEEHRLGLLVITGDKGLAGAYNHNVLKLAQQFLDGRDAVVDLFVVGELGRQYFTGRHIPIEENFQYTAQNPTFGRARWIAEKLLEKYQSGELNEIHVIYTRMENSMLSVAEDKKMLPLRRPVMPQIPLDVRQEEFRIEPSEKALADIIVPNYITGFIYSALVESFCCEHNARMQAMESATNNADELLHDLGIMYNRARQAAITQEITEVCGGARAQKQKSNN